MFDYLRYIFARAITRKPSAIRNSVINPKASVGNGAQIVNSTIGRYSYVYDSMVISTDVGNFCSIGAGCSIGGGSHPTDWVSTSPVFYSGRNCLHKNFTNEQYKEYSKTIIGNDVWIGSKCLIKGGITIGDGAIIGMGSVVTHDVEPYSIVAGNPAKLIRYRFNQQIILKMLEIKWWEFNDEKLKSFASYFINPQLFIEKYERMEKQTSNCKSDKRI